MTGYGPRFLSSSTTLLTPPDSPGLESPVTGSSAGRDDVLGNVTEPRGGSPRTGSGSRSGFLVPLGRGPQVPMSHELSDHPGRT